MKRIRSIHWKAYQWLLLFIPWLAVFSVNCSALAELDLLTVPGSVTVISEESFFGDTALKTVSISEGVQKIEERAFAYSSLSEVLLPDSIREIADNAFEGVSEACFCASPGSYAYSWAVDHGFTVTTISSDGFAYVTMGDGVQVVGYFGHSVDVTVPETIDGLPVHGVNAAAFIGKGLNSLYTLDGTLYILDNPIVYENAYEDNQNIRRVVFSNCVTEIRSRAFANDRLLEAVLPSSIQQIANDAFADGLRETNYCTDGVDTYAYNWAVDHNCTIETPTSGEFGYKKQRYYDDLTGENYYAAFISMYNGDSLDVVYPSSIDGYPVIGVTGSTNREDFKYMIRNISLPEGLRRIEARAFSYCISLTTINIPDTVSYIGESAFRSCPLTGSLELSENIRVVKDWAFYGTRFETIRIPDSLTSIGNHVFAENQYLQTVYFEDSLSSIGPAAFSMCFNLNNCYYNGTIAEWENVSIAEDNYYINRAHLVCTDAEQPSTRFQWTLENGVLTLSGEGESEEYFWSAYWSGSDNNGISAPWSARRDEITEVVINEGITSISGAAFGFCTNLQRVTLPSTLQTLGNTVFNFCWNMERIEIPEGVTSIGSCTFMGCFALNEIQIPRTMMSIGEYAFSQCPDSMSIYFTGTQGEWQMISGLQLARIPGNVQMHFMADESFFEDFGYIVRNGGCVITSYAGMDTVITIPAFIEGYPVKEINISPLNSDGSVNIHLAEITEVNLPETVEQLGEGAFKNWAGLRTINGLASVQSIGEYCFSGSGVLELEFSENLAYSGLYAFDANELRRLTIPDTLTWKGLNENAGYDFDTIFRNHQQLESINLIVTGNPPSLTMYGPALYNANMRTLICYPCKYPAITYRIPDGVVNSYAYAFDIRDLYATDGLYEVYIPNSVTGIANAFYPYYYIYDLDGTSRSVNLPRLVFEEGSPYFEWLANSQSIYYCRSASAGYLDTKVSEILAATVSPEMTALEKVQAINDYLIDHVSYDESLSHFGAEDALLYGVGTCQSYTLANGLLLTACGIENKAVVLDSISHSLNAVRMNGTWYYIDVTWNDMSGTNDYFAMNEQQFIAAYGINPNI